MIAAESKFDMRIFNIEYKIPISNDIIIIEPYYIDIYNNFFNNINFEYSIDCLVKNLCIDLLRKKYNERKDSVYFESLSNDVIYKIIDNIDNINIIIRALRNKKINSII